MISGEVIASHTSVDDSTIRRFERGELVRFGVGPASLGPARFRRSLEHHRLENGLAFVLEVRLQNAG